MIFACKSGVPTLEMMEKAEKVNDDGAGIAWREQVGKDPKNVIVRWKKGLTAKEVHKIILEKNLKDHNPFVVHFRAISSGGDGKELCHPFPISEEVETDEEGSAPAVLFHNGTYSSWESMMKDCCFGGNTPIPLGKWSDSRALAWLAYYRGVGALFLTNWGGNGRIAILNANGSLNLFGSGWVKGKIDGVIQSGELREFSAPRCSWETEGSLAWQGHGRHNIGVGYTRSSVEERARKITSAGLKCSLYEEGDKVELYTREEYTKIMDEIEKDIQEYANAC